MQDFARFADLAVSLVNGTAHDLQDFLMEPSVPQRLLKALAIVKKELELLQLQKDISRRVEEKFTKEQKRYFLMEQMKHIQKELGITKDEKAQVIQKFLDRFNPVKCDPLPAATSYGILESKIRYNLLCLKFISPSHASGWHVLTEISEGCPVSTKS
jgi:ATP-dependent Lon protease